MNKDYAPAIAANRFGLGARPGDLERIGTDARGWLIEQLQGTPAVLSGEGLRPSREILAEGEEVLRKGREAAKQRPQNQSKREQAEMATGDTGQRAANGLIPSQPTGRGLQAGPAMRGGQSLTFGANLSDTVREATGEAAKDSAVAPAVQSPPAATVSVIKPGEFYRPYYVAEITARLNHAVTTPRSFVERLTQFWTNHFAVSVDKAKVLGIAGAFEREAIRPHVLGNFAEMLLAVEHHPAMLLYLDNHLSVGPRSQLSVRRKKGRPLGINENLARETLELHTLGVNGGYNQADVTTFAKVITGWSIGGKTGPGDGGDPGAFMFRAGIHEPGAKIVLGKRYADEGEGQGIAVLEDLARKPATARFLATKLTRHFVADEPPAKVVDRVAKAYLKSNGDLPSTYRALLEAPEAWRQPFSKYKTPADFVVSTYRALELPAEGSRGRVGAFDLLGQRVFAPRSPAGWPDRGADWDGSSALMKRIEWADGLGQRLGNRKNAAQLAPQLLGNALSEATRSAIAHAASGAQALTLLLTAPEFLRR